MRSSGSERSFAIYLLLDLIASADRRFLSLRAARFLCEKGIRKILVGQLGRVARSHVGRDEVITSLPDGLATTRI